MTDEELVRFVRFVRENAHRLRLAPIVPLLDEHVARLLALANECLERRRKEAEHE